MDRIPGVYLFKKRQRKFMTAIPTVVVLKLFNKLRKDEKESIVWN